MDRFSLSQSSKQLTVGEDIPGLSESGDPAAILQPGVPPDMVNMQMGAHHIVDLIDGDTGASDPFSNRSVFSMFQKGRVGRGL